MSGAHGWGLRLLTLSALLLEKLVKNFNGEMVLTLENYAPFAAASRRDMFCFCKFWKIVRQRINIC